ncbi:MAG: DEAD/DEAH box helicase [Candidatus Staskawiczbacteria bacterium]|nr:DEAD/DEAH box helicase [Candidatus Staskawiczbacteria bacterium]
MNNQETKQPQTQAENTFAGLGISEKLLTALKQLNFTTPTPIQHKAIPVAIQGKDVVGIAQTGTGKSLAFGIPMLQRLMEAEVESRGLVILPTRELAVQINETLLKIGRQFGLKTAVLIGGASMYQQVSEIRRNPHIIIGTPGRINDHIKQKTLNFSNVSILVLDEADCMFDMGFAPQIKQILLSVPKNRQTMLFSATMPDSIIKIATQHMQLPVRVEMARQGTTNEKVEHELFFVKKDYKVRLLEKLLEECKGSVLVFCRTKFGVKKICQDLLKKGFSVAEIHSNRSLVQRRQALDGFKSGKNRVLIATDIASRGIDVKGIELVINFDLPESPGDYVHRIGRTGRAGMTGKAISFVMPDQRNKVREIERLIRSTIPILQLPELPASSFVNNNPTPQQQTVYKRNDAFEKTIKPVHNNFKPRTFGKGGGWKGKKFSR